MCCAPHTWGPAGAAESGVSKGPPRQGEQGWESLGMLGAERPGLDGPDGRAGDRRPQRARRGGRCRPVPVASEPVARAGFRPACLAASPPTAVSAQAPTPSAHTEPVSAS